MPPPPPRIWYVQARLFGNTFTLHTLDKDKIGPWLCDLMRLIPDGPAIAMPLELQVTIT